MTPPKQNNYSPTLVCYRKLVTFLYKLRPGVSEKSHGKNVAHMAGISDEVVDRAKEMAQDFEAKHGVKRAALSSLTLARKDDFSFLCQTPAANPAPTYLASIRNIWHSLQPRATPAV